MKFTHLARAEQIRTRDNPSRIIPIPRIRLGGRLVAPVPDPEEMSPEDHWRRISDNLDRWNAKVGRRI